MFVTRHSSLVTRHSYFHSSLVTCHLNDAAPHRTRTLRAPRRGDGARRLDVRALRLLPAGVSDLQGTRRGDGFAARAHLSDEERPRGRRAAGVGAAVRGPLPGVRRLRHGVSVRGGVRRIADALSRARRVAAAPESRSTVCAGTWYSRRCPILRGFDWPRRWVRRRAGCRGWCPPPFAPCSICCRRRFHRAEPLPEIVPASGTRRARRSARRLRTAGAGAAHQSGGRARARPRRGRGRGAARTGVLRRAGDARRRRRAGARARGRESPGLSRRRRCDRHDGRRLRIGDARVRPAAEEHGRGRGSSRISRPR